MAETARKSFGDPLVRFLVKFAQSLTAFASYSAHFIRNPPREVSLELLGSFNMTSLLGLLSLGHLSSFRSLRHYF